MSGPYPVTETIILHVRDSINLDHVTSDPAGQTFTQLTATVKAQPGFLRHYWGHQVEDPRVFVWSIDWKSLEYVTAFENSDQRHSFVFGLGQVFDLELAAPLTMYTNFTSDATAALAAPVTEVAFFTLPNDVRESAKSTIEEAISPSMEAVVTVGKSTGGATGWVFDTKNAGNVAHKGESIALHGVFGYTTVDDHVKWRQTPEHAQVIADMAHSTLGKLGLGNPRLPGGNIFVPDSSMFHVKFRSE